MEEKNVISTKQNAIYNHAPLTANGHPGPIGANAPKPVGMGPKQEQEENPKLRCMKEKIVKAIPRKLRNVPSNNVLFIVNGHLGRIGVNVLKPVGMGVKQEQEEPKLQCMKEKPVKSTTQKFRNVTSNNVQLTVNGEIGLSGLIVPKNVAQEYHQEPERMNMKLTMEEMNVMETK